MYFTKEEKRKRKNKYYIKILNKKNPVETRLEKQKRLAKMGKRLFDIYCSKKIDNSEPLIKYFI